MASHENELIDYESDEEEVVHDKSTAAAPQDQKPKKGDYVSMHSVGFRDLLLKQDLLKAIADCGFEHPSEVQNECIPQAILGTDVICQAKSGMGKTAVFVLSILQQIVPVEGQVSTLVLCHTRELAFQIRAEFERFKKYLSPKINTQVFYGGVPLQQHRDILKNKDNFPHIVIGTPGRILGLVNEKALDLSYLKQFILDECDKMLESLDMRKDVQEIFKKTPHHKQVMMFSATLGNEIRPVCKKFMHNPLEIYIEGAKLTLHGLQQYYLNINEKEKNIRLTNLIDSIEFNQLVIFVRSSSRADALSRILRQDNFPSICIHSDLKQEERIARYRDFKAFQSRIMVATNLFGRGIDIERVNVVINYDMPESADTYLHRVGRAGRFGTKGLAISFISSDVDATVLNDVQSRFVVEIKPMPAQIEVSSYMTN